MASRIFSQAARGVARASAPSSSGSQIAAVAPLRRAALSQQPQILSRLASTTGGTARDPLLIEQEHQKEHATKVADLWRKISLYICIPGSFVLGVYIYQIETAHLQHRDHEIAHNGGELPEEGKPKYEYQNIRKKPMPWGMQSLFFNPKANYPADEM